ncbi:zinc-ribbon domain-containing protein [Thalassovita taeanensis]|uniref:MJ0042 family finger-like domain-containing protein n=1 Tax=Thalassovita taeanensis TaxID=657014 RepID=A0A1H9DBL3_9RHOB|nr:zinc-ribbon domain-containing protein [Thalassovita taeanensis]SEQ10875.1 MJ0042 family finger-like domain-containing protein [Thalassovita taeanensis]
MRLICPNCGAQYEVPDGVIPQAGRDVQCSSCGNTWFQHHPDNDPDLAEELGQGTDQVYWDDDEELETAPAPEAAPEPQPEPDRRKLDPSIADVLREEAELEARARAADIGSGLESQPDLGLQEPVESESDRRVLEARQRMAQMRGHAEAPSAPDAAAAIAASQIPTSRRDMLPDIDEINSSLRATSGRRPTEADDHAVPKAPAAKRERKSVGGFRRGFSLALLLAAFLCCLYVFAGEITAQVPALKTPLATYVEQIDIGRGWLDNQMRALLAKLDSFASDAAGSTDQGGS